MRCNARQLDNGKCGLTGEGCIGETCMYHEPEMNKADRIRAMSDRELASFLAERYVKEIIIRLENEGYQPTATQVEALNETLQRRWLSWLRQPADSPEWDARDAGVTARAIDDRPYIEAQAVRELIQSGGGTDGGGTAV